MIVLELDSEGVPETVPVRVVVAEMSLETEKEIDSDGVPVVLCEVVKLLVRVSL